MIQNARKSIAVFCLFASAFAHAQVNVKDSVINTFLLTPSYSYQFPGGDIADRFGANSNIGMGALYKTRSNWTFGLEGTFIFGNTLREHTILDPLRTERGEIIGVDGRYADVRLFERGYSVTANVGKLFPVIGPNPNSGIVLKAGVGFVQHKIRIDVIGNTVVQLSKTYKKGYDRLTNGLALTQSVGYLYLGNRRLVNFYAGVDVMEGFTENRRTVNYDTGLHDDTKRLDILFGPRISWIIPLYKKLPRDFYYN